MTPRSSLYVGSVMHRRLQPRTHSFRYSAFWLLLDLDDLVELPGKLKWLSYNRPNIFSFYDADHGDGSATPLRTQIVRQLGEADVDITGGRVSLLCMPRTVGYCFNPLSIFFCYQADAALVALIYQVHNTFGERHSYIIRIENHGETLRQHCRKVFHVSPFLDMDLRYDFRIMGPDERIAVGISVSSSDKLVLRAVLTGERKDLTSRNLIFVFLKIPAITIKVIAAIHWEALRLWMKGIGLRRRPLPPHRPSTITTMDSAVSD